MKTIEKLEAEIESLKDQFDFSLSKPRLRKILTEIELREKAIEFLKTGPREEYLQSTIKRLKRKIELGRKEFERRYAEPTAKEWRHYKKDSGLARVEEFIHKIQIMVGGGVLIPSLLSKCLSIYFLINNQFYDGKK